MARILMVASEAAPFAKTGGLADVLSALPAALAARGDEVAVLLPRYRGIPLDGLKRIYDRLPVWLGTQLIPMEVYQTSVRGVSFLFLNHPPLFDRAGLYGESGRDYPDNGLRFAALNRAAVEVVRSIFRPDVVHAHDWQAGITAAYMRHSFALDPTFFGIKQVFTIHNLGYQGLFKPPILPLIGLDRSLYRPDLIEFYGDVSYLKTGILFADAITTVSPTYAQEIQTPAYGFGLDGLLRRMRSRLTGILNGADYDEWNPETDPHLKAHFSAGNLRGKRACKKDLLEQFGLPIDVPDRPLIGIVSRFATQKGFDLIADVAQQILELGVQLVVLGSGEAKYEEMFQDLAAANPDQVAVKIAYDDALAHKIEAGADMFLMPSHYEPCGLNQMYSLRYGTVPIVRATGGLDDTIDKGTGFKFRPYNGQALLAAVGSALAAWRDQELWTAMMIRGMQQDFSWNASAARYGELYQGLLRG